MSFSIWDLLFGKKSFRKRSVGLEAQRLIAKEWRNIEILLKGGQPSQLRQALISADKSLDNALKDLVIGDTMGERLKEAKFLFEWSFYQKLWEAHKVRNSLVHETGYNPPHFVLTAAVMDLKRGLEKLGVRL